MTAKRPLPDPERGEKPALCRDGRTLARVLKEGGLKRRSVRRAEKVRANLLQHYPHALLPAVQDRMKAFEVVDPWWETQSKEEFEATHPALMINFDETWCAHSLLVLSCTS